MKRSRLTEEQIIGILREHEAGVATAVVHKAATPPHGQISRELVTHSQFCIQFVDLLHSQIL